MESPGRQRNIAITSDLPSVAVWWQLKSTMEQSRSLRSSRAARAPAAARRPARLPSWAAAWRSWPATLKTYLWAPSDPPCPPPWWTSTRPSGCRAPSPAWAVTPPWPLTPGRGLCAGTRTARTRAVPLLSTTPTWPGSASRPATWSCWRLTSWPASQPRPPCPPPPSQPRPRWGRAGPTSATGWTGGITVGRGTAMQRSCWSTWRLTPTSPPRTPPATRGCWGGRRPASCCPVLSPCRPTDILPTKDQARRPSLPPSPPWPPSLPPPWAASPPPSPPASPTRPRSTPSTEPDCSEERLELIER